MNVYIFGMTLVFNYEKVLLNKKKLFKYILEKK